MDYAFPKENPKNFHFKNALHVTNFKKADPPCEIWKSQVNSVRPQASPGKHGYEDVKFTFSSHSGVLLFQVVAL